MPYVSFFDSNLFGQYIVHVNRETNLPIHNLIYWRSIMNKAIAAVVVLGTVALASSLLGKWTVKKTKTAVSVKWVSHY